MRKQCSTNSSTSLGTFSSYPTAQIYLFIVIPFSALPTSLLWCSATTRHSQLLQFFRGNSRTCLLCWSISQKNWNKNSSSYPLLFCSYVWSPSLPHYAVSSAWSIEFWSGTKTDLTNQVLRTWFDIAPLISWSSWRGYCMELRNFRELHLHCI